MVDRAPQRLFGLDPADRSRPDLFVEHRHPIAAVRLRVVHRRIGFVQHRLGLGVVRARGDGQSDARGDDELTPVDPERLTEVVDDRAGDVDRDDVVGDVVQHDDELVSTQPGHRVDRAAGTQALRHLDEQLVAGSVSERVVHRLEPVEVDEQHRGAQPVPPRAREGLAQAVDDERPVREAGERVVQGAIFERLFGGAPIGDVAHVRHDALDGGLVEQVRGAEVEPSPATVGMPPAHLDRVLLGRIRDHTVEMGVAHRSIVGVHEIEQVAPDEIVRAVAEDVLQRGADVRRARRGVDDDDDVGGVPHERPEPLRCPAQCFDRRFGLGRVAASSTRRPGLQARRTCS